MRRQKSQPKVLVVGGGVMGLMSALHLAEAGASVTLLERGEIGREASWAGGGILAPLAPWDAPKPVWELVKQSLARYPALVASLQQSTGIDCELLTSGMLVLDNDQWQQGKRWCEAEGLSCSHASANATEPDLPAGSQALLLPWVQQLRNPRLCQALKQALRQRGVTLLEGVGETRLTVERNVAAVQIAGETLRADYVVATLGAWTGEWLGGSGWSPDISPVAGQMLLLKGAPGQLRRVLLKQGRYLIPRQDGHILVGSTLEQRGFDKQPTASAAAELRQAASAMWPASASLPVVAQWCGLRPGSADGVPSIQQHPQLPNLFINAGHFRYGLSMAPASAERLTRLITRQI